MGRRKKLASERLTVNAFTSMDPVLYAKVREICVAKRWTVSTFLREATEQYVKGLEGQRAA